MNSNTNVLQVINAVSFSVKGISGEVTAPNAVDGDPEVFRKGGLRVVDRQRLNPLFTARRKGERLCLSLGTRFLGGYAVGDEHIDAVSKQLAAVQQEVYTYRETVEKHWDAWVNEWADKKPSAGDVIRACAPDAAKVASVIDCVVGVFKIASQEDVMNNAGVVNGIQAQVNSMAETIADEISVMACAVWAKKDLSSGQVSRKITNSLLAIKAKAQALIFVDRKIGNIVQVIDDVLKVFPKTGAIEGSDLVLLKGLFSILMDKEQLLNPNGLRVTVQDVPQEQAVEAVAVSVQAAPVNTTDLFDEDHPDTNLDDDEEEVVTAPIEVVAAPQKIKPNPAAWSW